MGYIIDVSSQNGVIDWGSLYAQGVSGVNYPDRIEKSAHKCNQKSKKTKAKCFF